LHVAEHFHARLQPRQPRTLRRTIVLYPTFALFLVPVLLIGFAGIPFVDLRALGMQDDAILPYMILHLGLPAVVVGFFGAVTLAAAMSTQDAITHAAATIFAKDLCAHLFRRELTPGQTIWLVRFAVLVFGAIAYLVAIYGGASLVRLLLGAYGSIVQILPMAIAALYWKRATAAGVLAGFIAGVALNFLISLKVVPADWTLALHAGLWGLGANVLLLTTVSLLTRPQRRTSMPSPTSRVAQSEAERPNEGTVGGGHTEN
jgi:SSS family solute:Na+ symporter